MAYKPAYYRVLEGPAPEGYAPYVQPCRECGAEYRPSIDYDLGYCHVCEDEKDRLFDEAIAGGAFTPDERRPN